MILLLALVACTAPNKATRALENQGFTDIEITGYSPFSCGEDDWSSTGFRAKNAQDQIVEGTVCCGAWKSCTVRW